MMLAGLMSRMSSRAGLGRLAMTAAESAVEEARAVLARRANTPGDTVFAALRALVRAPALDTRPIPIKLDLAALPATRRILESPGMKSFALADQSVALDLHPWRRLSDGLEEDFEGTARVSARVRCQFDRTIVRDLTDTVGFRVTRLALPPPLGLFAVVVNHPQAMIEGVSTFPRQGEIGGVDVNQLVAGLALSQLPDLAKYHDGIMRKLGPLARRLDFFRRLQEIHARVRQDGTGGRSVDHLAQTYANASRVSLPPFADAALDTVVVCPGAPTDLAPVHLQARLVAVVKDLRQNMTRFEASQKTIDTLLRQRDQSTTALRAHEDHTRLFIEHLQRIGHPARQALRLAARRPVRSLRGRRAHAFLREETRELHLQSHLLAGDRPHRPGRAGRRGLVDRPGRRQATVPWSGALRGVDEDGQHQERGSGDRHHGSTGDQDHPVDARVG